MLIDGNDNAGAAVHHAGLHQIRLVRRHLDAHVRGLYVKALCIRKFDS